MSTNPADSTPAQQPARIHFGLDSVSFEEVFHVTGGYYSHVSRHPLDLAVNTRNALARELNAPRRREKVDTSLLVPAVRQGRVLCRVELLGFQYDVVETDSSDFPGIFAYRHSARGKDIVVRVCDGKYDMPPNLAALRLEISEKLAH